MNEKAMRICAGFLALFLLAACASPRLAFVTQIAPPGGVAPPQTWTPPAPSYPTTTAVPHVPDSLTTAELEQRLDPFTAPECELPCYNGLVPGQGGLQQALDFYGRLGVSALDMIPGDYEGAQDGTGHLGAALTRTSDILQAMDAGFVPPRADLYVENDVVQYLYMRWDIFPAYLTLPRVLEMMGQPDRLDLGLIFGEDATTYVLQLVYTSRQTGFAFVGDAPNDGSQLQVCLSADRARGALLGIFAPDERPMADLSHESYLLPVQDSLGLTYADFAAQIGGGGCLVIPAAQWGQWQALGDN